MKKIINVLAVGMLQAGLVIGFGQPIITNQPQNQTNIAGTTAMLAVGATGTPPLFYQWRRYTNSPLFGNISGETNDTLKLSNVQPSTANFRYAAVVSDTAGSVTSALARLTVLIPPRITMEPENQSAGLCATVTFSLMATSSYPIVYQ